MKYRYFSRYLHDELQSVCTSDEILADTSVEQLDDSMALRDVMFYREDSCQAMIEMVPAASQNLGCKTSTLAAEPSKPKKGFYLYYILVAVPLSH